MKWTLIRKLARNKFVKSSYIFLIIVPIIARLFSKLESPAKIKIGEYLFELDLSLPFTWTFFYFAALLFTIGEILYSLFVPKMIATESSLSNYLDQRKDFAHLDSYLFDVQSGIKKLFNRENKSITIKSQVEKASEYYSTNQKGEYLYNEYYNVFNFLDKSTSIIRLLITLLFLFGLLLIGYNICENLFYVLQQFINNG